MFKESDREAVVEKIDARNDELLREFCKIVGLPAGEIARIMNETGVDEQNRPKHAVASMYARLAGNDRKLSISSLCLWPHCDLTPLPLVSTPSSATASVGTPFAARDCRAGGRACFFLPSALWQSD